MATEKKCGRCGDKEFRIDGFCSEYCRDLKDAEDEYDSLVAEYKELRRLAEAVATCDEADGLEFVTRLYALRAFLDRTKEQP